MSDRPVLVLSVDGLIRNILHRIAPRCPLRPAATVAYADSDLRTSNRRELARTAHVTILRIEDGNDPARRLRFEDVAASTASAVREFGPASF